MLLDVYATLDVDIKHHVLSCLALHFHLRLQSAIESVFVNLLVLQEFVVCNLLLEFLRRKEEIFHTILLFSSWRTRCAADRESQLKFWMLLHEIVHESALAATAWS